MNTPTIAKRASLSQRSGSPLNPVSMMIVAAALVLPIFLGQVSRAQTLKKVYNFTSPLNDNPREGTLAQGRDGKLYGTAEGGASGSGVIFRVTTAGSENDLHSFDNADGAGPLGGVSLASDGNFYGTAIYGGTHLGGVVFRISSTGTYTLLHSFAGGADGASPIAPPVEASDGELYGTTTGGVGISTVYQYGLSGAFATIYQFPGAPETPLVQGPDARLYGISRGGGTSNCGSIFKTSMTGVVIQSYSFSCTTGGANPVSLLEASDGNFYGLTAYGGTFGQGTVFRMTPNLGCRFCIVFKVARMMARPPIPVSRKRQTAIYMEQQI